MEDGRREHGGQGEQDDQAGERMDIERNDEWEDVMEIEGDIDDEIVVVNYRFGMSVSPFVSKGHLTRFSHWTLTASVSAPDSPSVSGAFQSPPPSSTFLLTS